MSPRPRPGILEVAAYVGGEAELPGNRLAIRLASNENPLGPSPAAAEAYGAIKDQLHRYPDGAAAALRQALAQAHRLDPGRIVCGAGSDELIALLVRGYAGPGDEVLYSRHGFLMYAIAAKTAGATAVSAPERNLTADVDALLERVTERTRLVFLANPNNPTGTYLPADDVARLHAGLPSDVLLVIDAAYAEYVEAADYVDGAALVEGHENVVMTRTFSKIHGLAALRLGWAYCPPAVADVLHRLRGPFNASAAAQAAGLASLADSDHLERSRVHNSKWRRWFVDELANLNIRAEPSVGNFVLVRFGDTAAAAAYLKDQGILVRRMESYGLPDHLRVTIGTDSEMRSVIEALRSYEQ